MKKGLIMILLVFAISWLTSCEKEVFDINPTMEAYNMESKGLYSVTIDSVRTFSSKVDGSSLGKGIYIKNGKKVIIK